MNPSDENDPLRTTDHTPGPAPAPSANGPGATGAETRPSLAERPPWVAVRAPDLPSSVVGFVVRTLPILEDDGRDAGERHATDYVTSVALPCSTKSQLWRRPSANVPKIGWRCAKRICPGVD
jgi:hypothetical protein